MFAIRITKSFSELSTFFDKLDQVAERHVWFQHDVPNNVHIHGYLEGCTVSTDTLKNYVRKDVGHMKPTEWSFKAANDKSFITYMSKGNLLPVFVKGFTESEIQDLTSKWVPMERKKSSMVQYKLKIENPTQAKIRQNELMDMVKHRCKEKHITNPRDVLEEIRQVVYVEHKTIVGRYKIRDFYDYVFSEIRPQHWLDNMEKLISYKDI